MKKKILVVEDEAIVGMTMRELLENWGYNTCQLASFADEAVNLAEECQPDLILMDVRLQFAEDGIDTARIIRSKMRVPVIFISGYSLDEIKDKTEDFELVDYMNKPVNFNELKKKIDKFFQN